MTQSTLAVTLSRLQREWPIPTFPGVSPRHYYASALSLHPVSVRLGLGKLSY